MDLVWSAPPLASSGDFSHSMYSSSSSSTGLLLLPFVLQAGSRSAQKSICLVSVYLCFCLSVVCVSACLCICVSIRLSVCPSFYLPVFPSVCPSSCRFFVYPPPPARPSP